MEQEVPWEEKPLTPTLSGGRGNDEKKHSPNRYPGIGNSGII